ncbi:MAG: SoxR reducing system RseC family protein [Salinivirgaceae bacterium]|jgi:sigma-E factor negative regulatory protein RseC
MNHSSISHQGLVESVNNGIVKVTITSVSACASCHAQGACSASDIQNKVVEATDYKKKVKPGDWVTVVTKESMGLKAVFFAYILPFILVLLSLIIGHIYSINESASGLISLSILIPYYSILYLFKNILKKSFIFEIES